MRLKIFLVEDNGAISRTLIKSLNERSDARIVGSASSQTEALAWLRDSRNVWNLAVIDLFLAQGSGLSVLEGCNGGDGDRKLVVLSNYATPEMRTRCIATGADRVFDKSTEMDEFLRYVLEDTMRAEGASMFGGIEELE